MSRKDSIKNTLLVATLLCIVCSVFVSTSAVGLKKIQERNKTLDRNENILRAAKLFEEGDDPARVQEIFQEMVETRLWDFADSEFADEAEIDPEGFDQRKAAKDPAMSVAVSPEKDIASVKRRSKYGLVYLVKDAGELRQVVVPVHGMGLWSTMYGFIALEEDTNTVRGFTFYDHGETPGLGGEVENPRWQALWEGKKVFDESGNVEIEVIKGTAGPEAEHKVDGLAGATITSRGVTNLLHYWLGEDAYGPLLERLRSAP